MLRVPRGAYFFLASLGGARALQLAANKTTSVLLLGCSIDRNAVEFFCQSRNQSSQDKDALAPGVLNLTEIMEARWCADSKLNINIASLFHPGVGYNGDLQPPFFMRWTPHGLNYTEYSPSTEEIMATLAPPTARNLLQGEPDIVVVDSSLWDLSAWHTIGEKDTSRDRVWQWCYHDLPHLLKAVEGGFPRSQVAFRTAPTFSGGRHDWPWFSLTSDDVADLYSCVQNATIGGKLLGRYPVIDYREVVQDLKRWKYKDVFMKDGMHPDALPSLLYINEILKTLGVEPPYVDKKADLSHMYALKSRKPYGR